MAWNTYSPLAYSDYALIVGNGPLAGGDAYSALIAAAQHYNRDPRAMLVQLLYENDFGRNISASQLANKNYAGIKFANQPGASDGGISPEGDRYARFDSVASFMLALAQSLGWYIGAFPSRLPTYATWVKQYPEGNVSIPTQANGGVTAGGGNLAGGSRSPLDIAGRVGDAVSGAIGDAVGNIGKGVATSIVGFFVAFLKTDFVERGILVVVGLMLIGAGISGLVRNSGAAQVATTAAVAAA